MARDANLCFYSSPLPVVLFGQRMTRVLGTSVSTCAVVLLWTFLSFPSALTLTVRVDVRILALLFFFLSPTPIHQTLAQLYMSSPHFDVNTTAEGTWAVRIVE